VKEENYENYVRAAYFQAKIEPRPFRMWWRSCNRSTVLFDGRNRSSI